MRTARLIAALSFLSMLYLPACGGGGRSPPPATYTIGGKMAGLTAGGLVLANGSDTVSPAPNATTFTFSMRLTDGMAFWSYSPSSGQWTWISGVDTGSATTVSPMYGSLGAAAVGNTPGSRDSAASWIDASGNLWLFGGELVSGSLTTSNSLNDLWEFNRQ
jgi:hypothetical protein